MRHPQHRYDELTAIFSTLGTGNKGKETEAPFTASDALSWHPHESAPIRTHESMRGAAFFLTSCL